MKVGSLLILGENEETGSVRPYKELRNLAPAAEQANLDTVWIYDHLLYHFEGKEPRGVWEGWTICSALAEATSRVELGALVLCTAFRKPAVLAKMAVTLDEVSEGRVAPTGVRCVRARIRTQGRSIRGVSEDHRATVAGGVGRLSR